MTAGSVGRACGWAGTWGRDVGGWVATVGWGVGTGLVTVTAGSVPDSDVFILLTSFIWDLLHTCSLSHCFNMTFGKSCVVAFPQP